MEKFSDIAFLLYDYHGGQWSAIYAYCGTGTMEGGLESEVRQAAKIAAKIGKDHHVERFSEFADYLAEVEASEEVIRRRFEES